MEIKIDRESNYLYHYTSKENLIEFILPTLRLKMNFLKNTNDPKEKKPPLDIRLRILNLSGNT